jgi:hypothetical protein
MRCHACTIFAFENRPYLGELEAEFKKALARESGAQGVLFYEKKPTVDNLVSRDSVPLSNFSKILLQNTKMQMKFAYKKNA